MQIVRRDDLSIEVLPSYLVQIRRRDNLSTYGDLKWTTSTDQAEPLRIRRPRTDATLVWVMVKTFH